jgi:hypothetical protein
LGECDGRVFRIGSIAKPTLAWRAPKQCIGGDKILEFGAGPPLQLLQLLWRVGLLLSSRVLTVLCRIFVFIPLRCTQHQDRICLCFASLLAWERLSFDQCCGWTS